MAWNAAQLAYAAVTLLVYGRHFAPEFLSSCGGQEGGRAPQTAPGKAAAVLDHSLAAAAPDDPPSNIPPPAIAGLPTCSASAADGPALHSEAGGDESPDDDVSVEQGEADADGWELLSKRARSTAEQVTGLHGGTAAQGVQSEASGERLMPESGAEGAGAGSYAERSRQHVLRRRGASQQVGERSHKAEEEDLGSSMGAAHGDNNEAANGFDTAAGPLTRMDVIWMCGVFTLQVCQPCRTLHCGAWHKVPMCLASVGVFCCSSYQRNIIDLGVAG